MTFKFQLRPYQKEACRANIAAMQRGVKRLLTCMATGGGKTVTFAELINTIWNHVFQKTERRPKVLWVAHRDKLLDQAQEKFCNVAPHLHVSRWDSKKKDDTGDVVLAMIGSTRKLKGNYDLVIVDEAHHVAEEDPEESYSNMYAKLLKQVKWDRLLGLTATPERLDGRDLAYDEIVYNIKFIDLVRKGRLAKPVYHEMRTNQDFLLQARNGEYTSKSLSQLNDPLRNEKIVSEWVKHRTEYGKTLLFAVSVQHCEDLKVEFMRQVPDVQVEVITGGLSDSERDRILSWYADGDWNEQKILINCEVFIEGLDEKSIHTVFMARPTLSKVFWLQMVGRGSRIVDFLFEVPETDIVKREPYSDDGVETFTFSNGAVYRGDDLGESAPGVRQLLLHLCDEFHLVNIMDDITKYHALVDDWQFEIREPEPEEIELLNEQRILREKKLKIKVLEEENDISLTSGAAALGEAQIIDVIAVLEIATFYNKKMGLPIDIDRAACLRRLADFSKECYITEKAKDPATGEETERWNFDKDRWTGAYSHCVLKGEIPFNIFEIVRHAFYHRFIRRVETIKHSSGAIYKTWVMHSLVDIAPESRAKYIEQARRDADAAKKMNEAFNQAYPDLQSHNQLLKNLVKVAWEKAKNTAKPKVYKRSLENIVPVIKLLKCENRRMTLLADFDVVTWPQMAQVNKTSELLTAAFQDVLNDPTALVLMKPKRVVVDSDGSGIGNMQHVYDTRKKQVPR